MSIEVLAVLLSASFHSILFLIALAMLYRVGNTRTVDDTAAYLQGGRIKEGMREMREAIRVSAKGRPATQWRAGCVRNA